MPGVCKIGDINQTGGSVIDGVNDVIVNGQPIAVISVCGPADRFKSELSQCVPLLLDSAARLSKRMGYIPKKKI